MRITAVPCYNTLDISTSSKNGKHPENLMRNPYGLQLPFPSLYLQCTGYWYCHFFGAM